MPFICKAPSSSMIGTYVDDGRGNYKGECVSLVKQMCPALQGRLKQSWKAGAEKITKGGKPLAPGTAIASFDSHGIPGHAAIYIGQNSAGIIVWDQYNGSNGKSGAPVGKHLIKFNNPTHPHYNADNFHVIK